MTVERILLVSLDNLGDLVFASALPPAIRARYPQATIGLWCKAYTADIAPLFPDVSWTTAADPFWDDAPGRSKGPVAPFLASIQDVRRQHFDVALVASPQWRVAAAVAVAGIPMRIGQHRNYNRGLLTDLLPPADRGKPVVADLGALLVPLGIDPVGLTTYLDPAPLEPLRRTYRKQLGPLPIAVINPFVTLSPVGIDWTIWWEVGRLLVERRYTVVWHGTAPQLEHFRRHISYSEPKWRCSDQFSSGTLREGAAVLASADVYFGCDSGPLHLSGAFGVPTVGVYPNASKLPRFAPQGRGPSRIVSGTITAEAIVSAFDSFPRHLT
ncbi:MAG TPA: glycosyltransferase family 9 protein [Gemmatimonadaceae bacterium]|nr:glycosyltransferase family 9 protein [Gemmatimonadaceae bacterium]